MALPPTQFIIHGFVYAGCACDEAGLKLLQGLVPIGRMRATMVSGMQRLCGQGVNASSLACMLSLT